MEHHRLDATFWRTLVVAAIALLALPAGGSRTPLPRPPRVAIRSIRRAACFPGPTTTSPNATREPPPAAAWRWRDSMMPRNIASIGAIRAADYNRSDGFSPGQIVVTYVPRLDLRRTGAAPVTDLARSLEAAARP